MAFREVTMVEIKEVLRQWLAGVGKKRIAARLGLDPKTVRRYARAAEACAMTCPGSFGRPRLPRRGAVIMVKSSEDGDRRDGAGEPCSGTFGRDRKPLVDPLVGSRRVEVAHCVLSEDVAEMPLREDDHVIETLAPDAPQESLAHRVHQRCPHGSAHDTGTRAHGDAVENRAELVVAVADNELRPVPERRRVAQLLRSPRLRWSARHRHVHDALGVHVEDEEREDGTEPDIVDLQVIAGPNRVVS